MFIGPRLKLAREAAGLTLRGLAEKVGLSHQAITKYERGLDVPSSGVLLKLSGALGVKTEFFFRPDSKITIVPAYRKHSSLGRKQETAIIARIQEWFERYTEVESLFLPDQLPKFSLPAEFNRRVAALPEVEEVAERLRCLWGLGLDPIENFMEMLESQGVKVGLVEAQAGFDACTFWAGGDPIIAVKRDLPGDRQRFNLAHELGHLVLEVEEELDPEKAAHRFAGSFLVPADAAFRELGSRRKTISLPELHLVKHKYGLSMQGWIYRAKDLGIISQSTATSLFKQFHSCGWHVQEPGDPIPPEEPTRLQQLALRATAEGLITEARAAELLGVPPRDFLALCHGGHGDGAEVPCH